VIGAKTAENLCWGFGLSGGGLFCKGLIVEIEIEPKQTDILGCVFNNVSLLTWKLGQPDIWTVSARQKAENELVEENNVKQPETCWGRKLVYQY